MKEEKKNVENNAMQGNQPSTGVPHIYKAMSDIMDGIDAIGKNSRNQTQGFQFRGIDDVVNYTHRLFAKHRVFVLPQVESFTVNERMTGKGGLVYQTRATIRFRFTSGIDGSYVESVQVGEAMDSGDKGMNKCMAIALKYALTQILLIPTRDIPDPDMETPQPTRPLTSRELAQTCSDPALRMALELVAGAMSREELQGVYRDNPPYQQNPAFINACNVRQSEINAPRA